MKHDLGLAPVGTGHDRLSGWRHNRMGSSVGSQGIDSCGVLYQLKLREIQL